MKNDSIKRILSSLILIPIVFFFIIKGSVFFIFFLGIFFLVSSYEWIKLTKHQMRYIGILYLLFCSYSAFVLRDRGSDLLLFVILICVSTDIGGYVFGKLFKGPKLIKISPNKTYAGMMGSFLLSIITGYLFGYLLLNFDTGLMDSNLKIFQSYLYINLTDKWLLILILLISAVSQIGDLIISYFKRLAKVKNTGNIIPGHGGLLDRVDGIIFAIPIALFFNDLATCYVLESFCFWLDILNPL
jgi:phosphatidate cytidylyltransferase